MKRANDAVTRSVSEGERSERYGHRSVLKRSPSLTIRVMSGLLLLAALFLPAVAFAQETPLPNKPNLANDQDAIKARYKRFNLTLQQMAEHRADLSDGFVQPGQGIAAIVENQLEGTQRFVHGRIVAVVQGMERFHDFLVDSIQHLRRVDRVVDQLFADVPEGFLDGNRLGRVLANRVQ